EAVAVVAFEQPGEHVGECVVAEIARKIAQADASGDALKARRRRGGGREELRYIGLGAAALLRRRRSDRKQRKRARCALAGVDRGEGAIARGVEAGPVADLELAAQPVAEREGRRPEGERLLVARQRFFVAAEVAERHREVGPRLRRAGIERGRTLVARHGFVETPQRVEREAAVGPGLRVPGLKRDRAVAALERFLGALQLEQRRAAARPAIRVLGPRGDAALATGQGLGERSGAPAAGGKIEPS